VGEAKTVGERPQAPWHPLPLSELLILVGIIGAVVAFLRGVASNAALLGAGIGAVAIGTIEVSLREHLGGFRSHALMLAVLPAVVFHSAVVLVVLALASRAPSWLNVALLPLDVALVVVCFKLLRARYVDARRERTFAGLR
jgi:disulfide bond formation protein DsbB